MRKVSIKRNPNGDTRTAPKNVTHEEFHSANIDHISDVNHVMEEVGEAIKAMGEEHDLTKLSYEDLFYKNFLSTINDGTDFVSDEWYQKHIILERHHLCNRCPDDVNLLDVIQLIEDCVCAGKTRSGNLSVPRLSDEILQKAFDNTIKLIDDNTEVRQL